MSMTSGHSPARDIFFPIGTNKEIVMLTYLGIYVRKGI